KRDVRSDCEQIKYRALAAGSTSLHVSRGSVRIPVRCAPGSATGCAGRLAVEYRGRVLGTLTFRLSAGRRWVARVRLTRRGRALALRVFGDADGRMNLSVGDAGGELLCVSNFTVYGDARRGNRPSFTHAARPERAEELYERVRARLGAKGGIFGAKMAVELVNDGPVTLVLDV